MATLIDNKYPMPQREDFADWRDYEEAQEKVFATIPQEKRLRFPVADGYAWYYIASLEPLVLQHIPFMDALAIPAAYVRGLTSEDARTQIEWYKAMRALFGAQA